MSDLATGGIPQHVAIIPDGNRRWAKQHGKSTQEGHKAGYENLISLADVAFERGIKSLTAYTFSTENWNRTTEEVGYLMKLAAVVVKSQGEKLHRKGYRLRILGRREGLDPKLAAGLDELEQKTKDNTAGNLNICFNYGGRADLLQAVNVLVAAGKPATEEDISAHLSTHGLPDPDLIIRTSGEQRLSNFLIWESAYSELYFSPRLWPEFDAAELDKALAEYQKRQRNFGV